MVSLSTITRGGIKYPPRIVAYGTDGIGKSTFGSQAEKPIFVCTEDGATRLDVDQFPLCKTWDELMDCLRALATAEHDYKTVVLDTADWGQYLAIEHVIKNDFNGDGGKFDAYGAGYKALIREWRKLLVALDYLNKRKGMEVILLLHATIRQFNNPLGDNYDVYKASLVDSPSTSLWGVTKEWADLVLFMNKEVVVSKDSPKASKGKAVLKQTRYIYTQPSAAYDAKVRAGWSLPAKVELDYEIFKARLNAGMGKPNVDTELEIETINKE
jgi:hypothetical protein